MGVCGTTTRLYDNRLESHANSGSHRPLVRRSFRATPIRSRPGRGGSRTGNRRAQRRPQAAVLNDQSCLAGTRGRLAQRSATATTPLVSVHANNPLLCAPIAVTKLGTTVGVV